MIKRDKVQKSGSASGKLTDKPVAKLAGKPRWVLWMPLLLVIILAFSSCRKELLVREAKTTDLEFSEDTVRFDSIFTTFDSPSERLIVTNGSNRNITIKRIYLRGGDQSEFEIIIDGMEVDEVEDFVIREGDSIVIFIDMKSQEQDAFARDQIVFETSDGEAEVELEAFVFDAFFYSYQILPCITVWDNTKPIIVDGIVRVEQGCTLVVQEGTQVHFTSRKDANFNLTSMLDIHGTLLVWGQPGNEVVFQNSRFGEGYFENPGQWRGLRFFITSENSEMEHAIVKNAAIGIEVDSSTIGSGQPKLQMRNTEIRNMSLYGIAGVGASETADPTRPPQIQAQNVLVHNCNTADLALLFGGEYQFDNCTFANYSIDFGRNSPLGLFNNYFEDTAGVFRAFDLQADFTNCLFWGSEEEEIAKDTFPASNIFNVRMNHCIARTSIDFGGTGSTYAGGEGSDGQFVKFTAPTESEADERDYSLLPESPGVDAGIDLSSQFADDITGQIRTGTWDIGCFEYRE